MSTVILMYPISVMIAAVIPGCNFLPVASLAAPYWLAAWCRIQKEISFIR